MMPQQAVKPQVVEVSTQRILLDSCCKTPRAGMQGECRACGKPIENGREAYEVKLFLPNGKRLTDPDVKAIVEESLPAEYHGAFEARLEKSSRDSTEDPNQYHFVITKAQAQAQKVVEKDHSLKPKPRLPLDTIHEKLVAKKVLNDLLKIATMLDEVNELDKASKIDEIINDLTK